MGVGSRTKAWRFTDINKDYKVRSAISAFASVQRLKTRLVLSDVPGKDGRSNKNKRFHVAVRF